MYSQYVTDVFLPKSANNSISVVVLRIEPYSKSTVTR